MRMLRVKINVLDELKKAGYNSYRLRTDRILSDSTVDAFRNRPDHFPEVRALCQLCDVLECQPEELVTRECELRPDVDIIAMIKEKYGVLRKSGINTGTLHRYRCRRLTGMLVLRAVCRTLDIAPWDVLEWVKDEEE